jgi:hypothetical protein
MLQVPIKSSMVHPPPLINLTSAEKNLALTFRKQLKLLGERRVCGDTFLLPLCSSLGHPKQNSGYFFSSHSRGFRLKAL